MSSSLSDKGSKKVKQKQKLKLLKKIHEHKLSRISLKRIFVFINFCKSTQNMRNSQKILVAEVSDPKVDSPLSIKV